MSRVRVTLPAPNWKGGRVDDCNGFENRRSESYRGFESLPFRSFLFSFSSSGLVSRRTKLYKCLIVSSECGLASVIKALLVELVDTLVLGTSAFSVRVRVPRRAKFIKYTNILFWVELNSIFSFL